MSKSFTSCDVQKIRLEKLMKNIDKPVEIPERVDERKFPEPPDFVRNVMGSSAGAGSGEFHVYRHLRRKEYARQRYIEAQAKKEELDVGYHQKLDEYKKIADEKTAKKRAKRLRKKEKMLKKKKTGAGTSNETAKEKTKESDESEESDEDEKEKQPQEELKND